MDNYNQLKELCEAFPIRKPVFDTYIIHGDLNLWGKLVIKNLHFTDLSSGLSIWDKQPIKIKVKVPEANNYPATFVLDNLSPKSSNITAVNSVALKIPVQTEHIDIKINITEKQ